MLASKVILEFTIYVIIVFASMILHELSHLAVARILGIRGSIGIFTVKRVPLGLKLVLEKYSSVPSFSMLEYRDRIHYILIALAPYWLFIFSLWLIYYSNNVSCIYAGYVILLFHIINLPLEFISL